ncbi:hypothetical protein ACMDCR_24265 [Labrys okinawensis]|uniref:hypothetical protein n=1 Tax=Labrys okinawensis TaxID=346911 RepID=UPI0039BC62CC
MSRITYYAAIPFIRTPNGELLGLAAEKAPSRAHAELRAFNRVGALGGVDTIIGAIAFSISGNPGTGRFVILTRYGETPEDIEDHTL